MARVIREVYSVSRRTIKTCDICGSTRQPVDNRITECPGCGRDIHPGCGVWVSMAAHACPQCFQEIEPLMEAHKAIREERDEAMMRYSALEHFPTLLRRIMLEALEERRKAGPA